MAVEKINHYNLWKWPRLSIYYIYYICVISLCVSVYHFHLPVALFLFALRCSFDVTSLHIIFAVPQGRFPLWHTQFAPGVPLLVGIVLHSSVVLALTTHREKCEVHGSYRHCATHSTLSAAFFLKTPGCFLCAAGNGWRLLEEEVFRSLLGVVTMCSCQSSQKEQSISIEGEWRW